MEDKKIKRQNIYKVIMLVILTATITFMLTTMVMYNKFSSTYINIGNTTTSTTGTTKSDYKDLVKTLEAFKTMIKQKYIGEVDEEKQKLVRVAKECLDLGLAEAKPWGYIGDIGAAISEHAAKNGYTVVQNIGGHGVGVEFHEEPYVSHVGVRGTDCLIVPGMTFTIEPMINMGVAEIEEHESDGWTIYTADRKPSAQWEYTILITEDGAEILAY